MAPPGRPVPLARAPSARGGGREPRGGRSDAEAGVVSAEAWTAMCVQRLDGSRNSAIHTRYRISLRSSSMREPRYPLLRVISLRFVCRPRRAPRTRGFMSGAFWSAVCPGRAGESGRSLARPREAAIRRSGARALLAGIAGKGRRGGVPPLPPREPAPGAPCAWLRSVSMILPQVHLRKPCYDFSFL